MPDAEGAPSPPAAHSDDSPATNPSAGLVAEDHPPKRRRGGWGRAGVFAVAAWLAWPTAAFAQLTLIVDDPSTIAGDGTINIDEKAAGFPISGNTGTEGGVTVEVTIGTGVLSTTSVAGVWSVAVPAAASYIMGTSVSLEVTAEKAGETDAVPFSGSLIVDLVKPTVSYIAPQSLTVGTEIIAMVPTASGDTDSYAISDDPVGNSLLRGLSLDGESGTISGVPTTGNPNTQRVVVVATDDASNTGEAMIVFPLVDGPEPGVTVDPEAGVVVPEAESATYTVVLDTEPTHEVAINVHRVSGDDSVTAAPTMLTFTVENWDDKQTVTLSAAEDNDGNDGTSNFAHRAVSNDTLYDGIDAPGINTLEDDNDSLGVKVSRTTLSVPEGGSATYTVRLGTEPQANVTVEASRDQLNDRGQFSDSDLTVSSETDTDSSPDSVTLAFTSSNWDREQTVKVSAAEDPDEVDGVAIFSHDTVSLDEDYEADTDKFTIDPVTATEADNDEDVIEPTATIQTEAPALVGGPFEVTIRFSESVRGFTLRDIDVTNGTASNFNKVHSRRYTVTITPEESGEVRVEVRSNVARDGAGNGNRAAEPLLIGADLERPEGTIAVSYQEESYTAREGGETVAVTVKLSQGWDEELAIPIRVTRPEMTEVADYRVEGLEGWDAEAGRGTLTFGADETERTWGIAANHDGDGNDETVELGFGELPEIVIAGEPSAATVRLEDKGLVELEVRFAQAAYEVKEGRGVDVEVSVSPAADRRVEVPLVVALRGGTTSEDYRGALAAVVLEEGESAGTISVEVLADEVNDSGEGIVLSFGALPAAMVAGDPSSTEVHFVQQRTAEQFSRTLEGMLAVMARSLGESARTAIEGRFARYRQWSRLGSSGGATPSMTSGVPEAVSGDAPTSGPTERPVSRGESPGFGVGGAAGAPGGGDGRAEPSSLQAAGGALAAMESSGEAARDPGAPGGSWAGRSPAGGSRAGGSRAGKSWLRDMLVGSLGRLARSDQIASGGAAGSGMGRSRNGYGETGLRGAGGGGRGSAGYSAGYAAVADRAFNLSGASFEMPLGERAMETSWVPAFWGQGDLQQFDGDVAHLGMNYRGGLNAAHVGLDLYANERMLAGLSFMRSWGELDYTDDGVDGVMESGLNTVHPYVYWQPGDRVSVWGIGGLGRGQVDVTEPGRTHDFGADFRMFAGGVRAALLRRGGNEWSVRADAFTTRLETGGAEDIAKVGGEAQRGRMMLEWVHDRQLSVGRSLSLQGEAGGRFDRGAADLGAGLETGFRLGYLDANQGLDVGVQGRVLLVHESDYRDWGVGVQASFDPGKKQRGFRASATTSWGRDGGGRTTLWDNADAVLRRSGMGATGLGSRYRLDSEVAYAGLEALGLPGPLTPYSRLRWVGRGRELAWGTAWSLPPRSHLELPSTLELEIGRRESGTGPADLGVLMRISLSF